MSFKVIANFKSNLTQKEVISWVKTVKPTPNIVVAPSFIHLSSFLIPNSSYALAAQDVSPFPPGSYTGAINAGQLKDLGVSYCIVGHSERRRYFHETTSEIAGKVRELLSAGITPIVCLEEKDIVPQFAALDNELVPKCIFCFEPSADIGGTTTAPHDVIKSVQLKVSEFAPNSPFMYGGSVTSDNISRLLSLGISGVLVATASLDPTSFNQLIHNVTHEL